MIPATSRLDPVDPAKNPQISDFFRSLPGRFQAKWKPVCVKKTRQIKNPEPRFDSIETKKALALQLHFLEVSESMGNHDSKIVDAGSID